MKQFVILFLFALCSFAFAEDEKNVDKRAIFYSSFGYPSYVYPYNTYLSLFKRETQEGNHMVQKREVSQEEEKTVDKRHVLLDYHHSFIHPISYYHALYKRDTAAQETEKNVDKRAVVLANSLYYPYRSLYWPYGIYKRETEEGNQHNVEKRDVNQEENKEKRDLVLGYGYDYPYHIYGTPAFRWWY